MALSLSTIVRTAALVFPLLITLSSVSACAVIGLVYCNKCEAGPFNSSAGDTPINGAKVSVTCSFSNSNSEYPVATFSGCGNTDANGQFSATLTSGNYPAYGGDLFIAFMHYVYKDGLFSHGLLPGVALQGCQINQIEGGDQPGCSVLAYNSGSCSGGRKSAGNGGSGLSTTLTNDFGSDSFSNIYLGIITPSNSPVPPPSVCLTNPTRPISCPATPGVKGDPHFSGADGSHFDFSGIPNTTYCLLSDAHVHVNAYYGGRYGEYEGNMNKTLTWIRQVGVMWGHHTIHLAAREGVKWQYDTGYMATIKVDGETITLSQPGDKALFTNGKLSISWVAAKESSGDDEVDVYQVDVDDVISMRITLRPEVKNLRSETDGVIHMNLDWPVVKGSESIHGVLGQTYRKDFQDRLAHQNLKFSELLQVTEVGGENAEGFLDGNVSDYVSSSILRPDCKISRFARASERDSETAQAREMAMGRSISTIKASRKVLNVD